MDVSILKSNAEYGKSYYVDFNGLRECKFLGTQGRSSSCPCYHLDIAGIGETLVRFSPSHDSFLKWWNTSKTNGILYESVEDFRKGNPIVEDYGTTANAYNSGFLSPLFPHFKVCGCGGGIYSWRWYDNRATLFAINTEVVWSWNKDGFMCNIERDTDGRDYSSKESCESANEVEVIKF